MRNALAVTLRILRQYRHDPRTIFMMIIAPVLALFLLNILFGAPIYEPLILHDGLSAPMVIALEGADARVEERARAEAMQRLEDGEADAFVESVDDEIVIYLEGSNVSHSAAVMRAVSQARTGTFKLPQIELPVIDLPLGISVDLADYIELPDFALPGEPEVVYIHGDADMRPVDFYGPVFIGVFVFFFVFITSGVSFLRERTGGTLWRLMGSPIRRWELVAGYTLGFGLFSFLQTVLVTWASIAWVGFPNAGELWLVMLVAESLALVSLLLGIFVSEYANSEFQVIQMLQIVIVPQVLLCGMFDLSQTPGWMQFLSSCFPLTYGADAMRAVMLRGASIAEIGLDLGVLWGFIVALLVANTLALKKYRRI